MVLSVMRIGRIVVHKTVAGRNTAILTSLLKRSGTDTRVNYGICYDQWPKSSATHVARPIHRFL